MAGIAIPIVTTMLANPDVVNGVSSLIGNVFRRRNVPTGRGSGGGVVRSVMNSYSSGFNPGIMGGAGATQFSGF
ncbi:protein ORF34 [Cyprinid herpesvirus 1]|uniref:Protein ORF34 n=1 Tax=Cyprinid herpesvirus 1 TaxID=317858 RepID=K7PBV7_9VIRU|nr:protein ORF34 [Cyprinid herpesvirus 1]AFJ20338.1 protein ORF34 [Cyprinid herpesvirus 1]